MKKRYSNILPLLSMALAIVVVGGVGTAVCVPKHYELELLRQKVKHERYVVKAKARTSRFRLDISVQLAEARKHGEAMNKKIPQSARLLQFLSTVAELAKREGLTNRTVEHGRPVDFNGYRAQAVFIELDGKFSSLCRFLSDLERNNRLCWIDSLELTKSGEDGHIVHLRLCLSIFYHNSSAGERPRASVSTRAKVRFSNG